MTDYLEQIKISASMLSSYLIGIVDLIQEIIPDAEIHLSTQANMTNFRTARFWHKMGVKAPRTGQGADVYRNQGNKKNIPSDMEVEAFVHGAMCISYSGRCLLSNFMIERDANRGMCATLQMEIFFS